MRQKKLFNNNSDSWSWKAGFEHETLLGRRLEEDTAVVLPRSAADCASSLC